MANPLEKERVAVRDKGDENLQRALSRMPEHIRESFTPEQLHAIRAAITPFQRKNHSIFWRATLRVWRSRYYYVFIAGRDRRKLSRREEALERKARVWAYALVLWCLMWVALFVLYLVKSLFNINLLPEFSFGIMDWLRDNVIN